MKILNKLIFVFSLSVMVVLLCGCPPLKHKIFVRNKTADTAYLTFIYKNDSFITKKNIQVRSLNKIVAINNKTIAQLNEQLTALADSNKINLAIPPKSTVFISDIINSFYMFADKKLIIQHGNEKDTMDLNYPYKRLKDMKRKRSSDYHFFYRTIVYLDIK